MIRAYKKYQLTFAHKFMCIGLLALAVLFCGHSKAYQKEFSYGSQGKGISFLQKGDYVFEVYYKEAPKNNEIIIYSEALTNAENQLGLELQCVEVGTSGGVTQILLELERDTRDIYLKTTQDMGEEAYINRVVVQSVQLLDRDNYLLGLLCILGAAAVLLLGWFVPTEKYGMPAVLLVLGMTASMPLFSDFIINGDDLGFHVARLEAVYQGLQAGEFPVYLGTNKMGGFGMLSATMYPDLFLYPFALLRSFGISLMLCYKLLVVCINIGSAFASYYAVKNMCKSTKIGFWASVFYTFSIYRLTNIYFRAALGETLAMVFLPLVIWGIYEVLWGDYKKWYLLAFGVGGVLQSHVLSVEMCVFFLVIEAVVFLLSKRHNQVRRRIVAGLKAAGMTVLVNTFFLVPFLFFYGENLQCFDMPNELSETVVYFSQMFSLFAAPQGMDLETGSTVGEMPHTVGIVLLLGAVLLCAEALQNREEGKNMQVGRRCLVYGMAALLLSSWLFPWEQVQEIEILHDVVTSLQFAWRFLGPASALLSVAAAVGVVCFGERSVSRKWIYGVCAALVICSSCYFFDMKGYVPAQYGEKMEFNDFGYTDSMYMYSDGESFKAWHLDYDWSDAYIRTKNGSKVAFKEYSRRGTQLQVTTEAAAETGDYLLFPLYYYPGYEILVDGQSKEVLNVDSRVACKLPGGTARIEVSYQGMPEFAVANWVSLLTVIGIVVYNTALFAKKKHSNAIYLKRNAK